MKDNNILEFDMGSVSFDKGIIAVENGFSVEASEIRDLLYFPSPNPEHIWKDDALFIYLRGDAFSRGEDDLPSGWSHAIWGEAMIPFLIAVRKASGYDISGIISRMEEKERLFSSMHCAHVGKSLAELVSDAESSVGVP